MLLTTPWNGIPFSRAGSQAVGPSCFRGEVLNCKPGCSIRGVIMSDGKGTVRVG
jgi:hypothetical protein